MGASICLQAGVQPWEELVMIGLHYAWYLGMVFSFLPIWKGLLFVVLSQVLLPGVCALHGFFADVTASHLPTARTWVSMIT